MKADYKTINSALKKVSVYIFDGATFIDGLGANPPVIPGFYPNPSKYY